jgi:hypothetical protein
MFLVVYFRDRGKLVALLIKGLVNRRHPSFPKGIFGQHIAAIDNLLFWGAPDPHSIVSLHGAIVAAGMPSGSGLQPFTGLPTIVGMLPAMRRNRCPRWVGLRNLPVRSIEIIADTCTLSPFPGGPSPPGDPR